MRATTSEAKDKDTESTPTLMAPFLKVVVIISCRLSFGIISYLCCAGMYEGGFQHGQGVIRYSTGHVYKGGFNNSKMEGEGILTYKGLFTCFDCRIYCMIIDVCMFRFMQMVAFTRAHSKKV